MATHAMNELLELLMSERADIRLKASLALAQLSGSSDGAAMVGQCRSIMSVVVASVATTDVDDETPLLATTLTTLTNVAVSSSGAKVVTSHHNLLLKPLLKLITTPTSRHADRAAGLLTNITRDANCCRVILTELTKDTAAFQRLLMAACNTAHNTADNNLHLVLSAVENMSQLQEGRKLLMNRKMVFLQRLLPFTSYVPSITRRRATVAVLHNCCFSKDDHSWLLSKDVDIASHLCLPLAGPDNFSEEETSELSDMLIYLPEDKKIEENIDIRVLLMGALMQLCTTREGRVELRRQNVYYVLREYHKWETEYSTLVILEDLVNILVRTEDEIGVEDISTVEVTEDMHKKFIEMDKPSVEDPPIEKATSEDSSDKQDTTDKE